MGKDSGNILSLNKLRADIHNTVLEARSIYSYVWGDKFGRLWEYATPEEKKNIIQAVNDIDKEALLKWMVRLSSKEIGDMNCEQLRKLAQEMSIKGYSRMTKIELVSHINQEQNKNGTT